MSKNPPKELTNQLAKITNILLTKDRQKASDVLLQLQYQFSRQTSSIEIKIKK